MKLEILFLVDINFNSESVYCVLILSNVVYDKFFVNCPFYFENRIHEKIIRYQNNQTKTQTVMLGGFERAEQASDAK
jgi:hypothetical protein